MLEKKHQDKIKTIVELEKIIAEILVANGRAIEPFVKVFTYSGENVTKSSLGTLVGVFEITERSEESAYIVNFLASVAKKEYFNNPRRSAIESFEAALHKINLALAELVKQDNIAWLGKFHGALGILEKNSLHFSVTGKAEILLLRNNSFSQISAGLASLESHIHPIKTFVEVSSGHLTSQDRVILSSPELLNLLPLEDLEKNALRMDRDHFGQFLRTALVNELDMAGAIVIDFEENKPAPTRQKQEEKTAETPRNVFSQEAFSPKIKTPGTDSFQKEDEQEAPAPEEYVDSKTGHIYVQGDTLGETETNHNLERVKLSLQNMLHGLGLFVVSQGKILRKGKKYSSILSAELVKTSAVTARKTARFLRKQLRKRLSPKLPAFPEGERAPQVKQSIASSPKEPETLEFPLPQAESGEEKMGAPLPAATPPNAEIPPFMMAKLAAFYQKKDIPKLPALLENPSTQHFINGTRAVLSFIHKISQKGCAFLSPSGKWISLKTRIHFRRALFFLKNFSPRKQIALLLGCIACIVVLAEVVFHLTRPTSDNVIQVAETPKLQTETSAFPLTAEKNAHPIESLATLAVREDPIVTAILLGNETYLITEKNIVSSSDKKQYTLPGNGSIRLAALMDDLSLIFIYTDIGELFAWSPVSHTFVPNTLALPAGTAVKDIGTYLTYLYVLDGATNQIYRFPRAEGGFGQGTPWMKDNVVIQDAGKMAVSDTIFLAPNKSAVQAFFRGRFVKNLESPNTALSVTNLYTHPGLANIYALDTTNKRVLVWNQDGTLIAQYFSEKLTEAQTLTVNEKTSEVFLTTSNSLLSFKFNL